MSDQNISDIVQRKSDHIDVVLNEDVGFGRITNGLDAIQFVHNAVPELDLSKIDLSTRFFAKSLNAPLLISSMTGGPNEAQKINIHLCEAAQELGIAFAVGSQRVALEQQGAGGLTRDLRQKAPDVPLFGNIGAAQLISADGIDKARRAIEMIEADGLFVHLNPLQEAVQSNGDTNWSGVMAAIQNLVQDKTPIIIKEVGFGLSQQVIKRMMDIGVEHFDVAGAGGTNWARVEGARSSESQNRDIASAFTEWGIPTAKAVQDARGLSDDISIIASGGIKTGVDVAKSIRIGANLVGQAAGSLSAATHSTQAVIDHFRTLIETVRIVCFCTGSKNLDALRKAPLLND